MKANPIANEERLRVQRDKNKKYQQRVKESIATATVTNLVTKENDDSVFSQAHIRSRSVQKVAKTLPKSPRKRSPFSSWKIYLQFFFKNLHIFRKWTVLLYWCDNGGVSGWLWGCRVLKMG